MLVSQLRRSRLLLDGNRSRIEPEHSRYINPIEEIIILDVANGRRNEDIESTLALGPTAVKSRLNRLFGKFDLRSRAELVVVAYETGLIVPGWASAAEFVHAPLVGRDYYPSEAAPRSRPLVPLRP